jgi:hypothetical protein
MIWIWDKVLKPVLDLLYVLCDALLGWTALLGTVGAVTAVGILSGIVIILIQKYGSNQDLLGRCREDLKELKRRLKDAKKAGDKETLKRLSGLSGRIGAKYMGRSLLPALWTVPLITVVGLWTGARMAFQPVRPGDVVEMVAHFEDGAGGFAHVLAGNPLSVEGPAIAAIEVPKDGRGRQALWKVRAAGEGESSLRVRHSDRTYEVALPVKARGGRPPASVVVFNEQSPAQDQLQAVELRLRPGMAPAWWNLWLEWAGLYLLAAVGCALALRYALKVK